MKSQELTSPIVQEGHSTFRDRDESGQVMENVEPQARNKWTRGGGMRQNRAPPLQTSFVLVGSRRRRGSDLISDEPEVEWEVSPVSLCFANPFSSFVFVINRSVSKPDWGRAPIFQVVIQRCWCFFVVYCSNILIFSAFFFFLDWQPRIPHKAG